MYDQPTACDNYTGKVTDANYVIILLFPELLLDHFSNSCIEKPEDYIRANKRVHIETK